MVNDTNNSNKYINSTKVISSDEVKKQSINYKEESEGDLKERKKALKASLKKKREKEKFDYINFLLILAIFLLMSFIIVPPVLRKVLPKNIATPSEKKENITMLSCTGINVDEQYMVNSRVKYVDGITKQNIITYTKLNPDEVSERTKIYPITTTSCYNEINYFQGIISRFVNVKDNTTVVKITDYLAERNNSDSLFMRHFQKEGEQKKYYEALGYQCTNNIE